MSSDSVNNGLPGNERASHDELQSQHLEAELLPLQRRSSLIFESSSARSTSDEPLNVGRREEANGLYKNDDSDSASLLSDKEDASEPFRVTVDAEAPPADPSESFKGEPQFGESERADPSALNVTSAQEPLSSTLLQRENSGERLYTLVNLAPLIGGSPPSTAVDSPYSAENLASSDGWAQRSAECSQNTSTAVTPELSGSRLDETSESFLRSSLEQQKESIFATLSDSVQKERSDLASDNAGVPSEVRVGAANAHVASNGQLKLSVDAEGTLIYGPIPAALRTGDGVIGEDVLRLDSPLLIVDEPKVSTAMEVTDEDLEREIEEYVNSELLKLESEVARDPALSEGKKADTVSHDAEGDDYYQTSIFDIAAQLIAETGGVSASVADFATIGEKSFPEVGGESTPCVFQEELSAEQGAYLERAHANTRANQTSHSLDADLNVLLRIENAKDRVDESNLLSDAPILAGSEPSLGASLEFLGPETTFRLNEVSDGADRRAVHHTLPEFEPEDETLDDFAPDISGDCAKSQDAGQSHDVSFFEGSGAPMNDDVTDSLASVDDLSLPVMEKVYSEEKQLLELEQQRLELVAHLERQNNGLDSVVARQNEEIERQKQLQYEQDQMEVTIASLDQSVKRYKRKSSTLNEKLRTLVKQITNLDKGSIDLEKNNQEKLLKRVQQVLEKRKILLDKSNSKLAIQHEHENRELLKLDELKSAMPKIWAEITAVESEVEGLKKEMEKLQVAKLKKVQLREALIKHQIEEEEKEHEREMSVYRESFLLHPVALPTVSGKDGKQSPARRGGASTNMMTISETVADLESLNLALVYTLDAPSWELSRIPASRYASNVRNMLLAGNRLTTTKGVHYLEKLRYLDVSNNLFECLDLMDMTRLVFLNVAYNQLKTFANAERASSLRYLNLQGNAHFDLYCLRDLEQIHILGVGSNTRLRNEFQSFDAESSSAEVGGSASIADKNDADEDPFASKKLAETARAACVTFLNQASCLRALSHLKRLLFLELNSNYLSWDGCLQVLTPCEYLIGLFINSNNFKGVPSPLFGKRALYELSMVRNKMKSVDIAGTMLNVHVLKVDYNQISGFSGFGNVPFLTALYASNNNLSSLRQLSILSVCSELEVLDLRQNNIIFDPDFYATVDVLFPKLLILNNEPVNSQRLKLLVNSSEFVRPLKKVLILSDSIRVLRSLIASPELSKIANEADFESPDYRQVMEIYGGNAKVYEKFHAEIKASVGAVCTRSAQETSLLTSTSETYQFLLDSNFTKFPSSIEKHEHYRMKKPDDFVHVLENRLSFVMNTLRSHLRETGNLEKLSPWVEDYPKLVQIQRAHARAMDYLALYIQACWRTYIARRDYLRALKAIKFVQVTYKSLLGKRRWIRRYILLKDRVKERIRLKAVRRMESNFLERKTSKGAAAKDSNGLLKEVNDLLDGTDSDLQNINSWISKGVGDSGQSGTSGQHSFENVNSGDDRLLPIAQDVFGVRSRLQPVAADPGSLANFNGDPHNGSDASSGAYQGGYPTNNERPTTEFSAANGLAAERDGAIGGLHQRAGGIESEIGYNLARGDFMEGAGFPAGETGTDGGHYRRRTSGVSKLNMEAYPDAARRRQSRGPAMYSNTNFSPQFVDGSLENGCDGSSSLSKHSKRQKAGTYKENISKRVIQLQQMMQMMGMDPKNLAMLKNLYGTVDATFHAKGNMLDHRKSLDGQKLVQFFASVGQSSPPKKMLELLNEHYTLSKILGTIRTVASDESLNIDDEGHPYAAGSGLESELCDAELGGQQPLGTLAGKATDEHCCEEELKTLEHKFAGELSRSLAKAKRLQVAAAEKEWYAKQQMKNPVHQLYRFQQQLEKLLQHDVQTKGTSIHATDLTQSDSLLWSCDESSESAPPVENRLLADKNSVACSEDKLAQHITAKTRTLPWFPLANSDPATLEKGKRLAKVAYQWSDIPQPLTVGQVYESLLSKRKISQDEQQALAPLQVEAVRRQTTGLHRNIKLLLDESIAQKLRPKPGLPPLKSFERQTETTEVRPLPSPPELKLPPLIGDKRTGGK